MFERKSGQIRRGYVRRSGIINYYCSKEHGAIEALLKPSMFLGTVVSSRSLLEHLSFSYSVTKMAEAEKLLGGTHFKPGQFILEHQYMGHECLAEFLLGIFMPLSSCDEPMLSRQLADVTAKFQPRSGRLLRPEDRERWGRVIRDIGLPDELHPLTLDEALIRFDPRKAYPLLQKHFRYVTEFIGMSNEELQLQYDKIPSLEHFDIKSCVKPRWSESRTEVDMLRFREIERINFASRKINKLADLPWETLRDFSDWLSRGEQFQVRPEDIFAALIYENSD